MKTTVFLFTLGSLPGIANGGDVQMTFTISDFNDLTELCSANIDIKIQGVAEALNTFQESCCNRIGNFFNNRTNTCCTINSTDFYNNH